MSLKTNENVKFSEPIADSQNTVTKLVSFSKKTFLPLDNGIPLSRRLLAGGRWPLDRVTYKLKVMRDAM